MFKKNQNEKIEHPEKFKNFDNFLFIEIIDYLSYIREFMSPRMATAEFLAKTDAMLLGFRHGFLISEARTSSCPCCKYWCAGANCPIIRDAWQFFIEEIPNFKVLLVKTEL